MKYLKLVVFAGMIDNRLCASSGKELFDNQNKIYEIESLYLIRIVIKA